MGWEILHDEFFENFNSFVRIVDLKTYSVTGYEGHVIGFFTKTKVYFYLQIWLYDRFP